MVSLDQVKELRQETGVSITECKKALEETGGDLKEAKKKLREWGKELAGKKSDREAGQGIIESYIHPNKKVGVLLDLHCETDFVAKSKDFKELAHELCLQIAAMKPLFVKEDDVPEEVLDEEKKIYEKQMKDSGKSKDITNQAIEGKIKKFRQEISLLSQSWVKDDSKTMKDLIEEYIAKIGENINVKDFTRYEI